MFDRFTEKMRCRSAALLITVDNRLDRILQVWLLTMGFVAAARIGFTPERVPIAKLPTIASYLLLILAPFVSTLIALHWFRDGDLTPQPRVRLAIAGRWRSVSLVEAQRHSLYGCGGIMASLLLGMMLNVPVRAAEYLAAIPPMPNAAPQWLSVLHGAMTFDVVLFGSLYMIAFVAALRRSPAFPRLLATVWAADLGMQLLVAKLVSSSSDLPPAVASALHHLLEGNVKKVLISAALWLPYLLLSQRVNITFRHRIPA